jgi:hypothetical protein
MDLVEAVEQVTDRRELWRDPATELPMDHSAWFETALPLVGVALAFVALLARSLP